MTSPSRVHSVRGGSIKHLTLILLMACGGNEPPQRQPGTLPSTLVCVTPSEGQCQSNADCPAKALTHRVKSGETLAQLSKRYATKKEVILETNALTSPKQVDVGLELIIPIIFECAKRDDTTSVCAKSNGMCNSGDKCQQNEVCDFRYTHTDHKHLYKHGICICADAN